MSSLFYKISRRSLRFAVLFFTLFIMVYAYSFFYPISVTRAYSNFNEVQTSWGGYVAQGLRGTYKGVQAYFTVPYLTASPTSDGLIDTWVGVGDGHFNPTVLVQTGIRSSWDLACIASSTKHGGGWWVMSFRQEVYHISIMNHKYMQETKYGHI